MNLGILLAFSSTDDACLRQLWHARRRRALWRFSNYLDGVIARHSRKESPC